MVTSPDLLKVAMPDSEPLAFGRLGLLPSLLILGVVTVLVPLLPGDFLIFLSLIFPLGFSCLFFGKFLCLSGGLLCFFLLLCLLPFIFVFTRFLFLLFFFRLIAVNFL